MGPVAVTSFGLATNTGWRAMRRAAPVGPRWRPTLDWLARLTARGRPRGCLPASLGAAERAIFCSWRSYSRALRSAGVGDTLKLARSGAKGRYSSGGRTGNGAPPTTRSDLCPKARRPARERPIRETNWAVRDANEPAPKVGRLAVRRLPHRAKSNLRLASCPSRFWALGT